jgi:hypothetical protein
VAVLWSLLSWRRKSVTEEFGRFTSRLRMSGGMSTAAQAAAITSKTSSPTVVQVLREMAAGRRSLLFPHDNPDHVVKAASPARLEGSIEADG